MGEPDAQPDGPARRLLLLAMKVLVNLTNGAPAVCAQLLAMPHALPLVGGLLAHEFSGSVARGGLARCGWGCCGYG